MESETAARTLLRMVSVRSSEFKGEGDGEEQWIQGKPLKKPVYNFITNNELGLKEGKI